MFGNALGLHHSFPSYCTVRTEPSALRSSIASVHLLIFLSCAQLHDLMPRLVSQRCIPTFFRWARQKLRAHRVTRALGLVVYQVYCLPMKHQRVCHVADTLTMGLLQSTLFSVLSDPSRAKHDNCQSVLFCMPLYAICTLQVIYLVRQDEAVRRADRLALVRLSSRLKGRTRQWASSSMCTLRLRRCIHKAGT